MPDMDGKNLGEAVNEIKKVVDELAAEREEEFTVGDVAMRLKAIIVLSAVVMGSLGQQPIPISLILGSIAGDTMHAEMLVEALLDARRSEIARDN